jgi:protein SCO1/2
MIARGKMSALIRAAAPWMVGASLLAAAVPSALAHSVEDVEASLGSKEVYFQKIDKPAPDFTLRNADGRVVRLADFKDKVLVLHFVYTHCPDVCPLHARRITDIQALVNQANMKDQVRFITITTDPTRDTPDVMREYGKVHGLDPSNWLFLTTTSEQPEDATRRLAEAFGHKFAKEEGGYQMHGIVTHVIDRDGRWRGNFHGLEFDPVNMVVFVNALVNADVPHHTEDEGGLWNWINGLF